MKILFTNIGRRTYLLENALKLKKEIKQIKIYVTDCNIHAPGMNYHKDVLTSINYPVSKGKKKYLSQLLNFVKKNNIDIIFPVSDYDIKILSESKKIFLKKNCIVIVPEKKIAEICFDKVKMYNFCILNNIKTPKIYKNINIFSKKIIAKHKRGSGSVGIIKYNKDVIYKKINTKKYIFQEFLKGEEYGVDILNDLKGNFLSCCIKKKLLMRSGETDQAIVKKNKKLEIISKKISHKIKHIGNLDCDFIKFKKDYYLIDLNPRFGGGYPFTYYSGHDYLKTLIQITLKNKYTPLKNKFEISLSKGISLHKRVS